MKKLTVLVLCAALVGCGESGVDTVKDMTIPGYGNFTYGKVLDNHKVCESAEWNTFEEKGVKKVSYVCSLKKGKKFYSFDEKVAEKIRQDKEEEYMVGRQEYLKKMAENNAKGLKESEQLLAELNAALNVDDYIKMLVEAKAKGEFAIVDIQSAINKAVGYGHSPLQAQLDVLNPPADRPMFAGYSKRDTTVVGLYKEKAERGFTSEEAEAFKQINNAIRDDVRAQIKDKIEGMHIGMEGNKKYIAENEALLADKETIKAESKKAGENAVRQYAMTHIVKGEEVIVWAWNPVAEQYDIETQYRKQYEYAGTVMTSNLYMDQVIYSSVKNISDVDTYMGRGQAIAAAELYRMIQSGQY